MRWVLTTKPPEAHGHIEVGDPEMGAILLNQMNDAAGHPVHARIEEYHEEWHCPECGQWRLEREVHHGEGR